MIPHDDPALAALSVALGDGRVLARDAAMAAYGRNTARVDRRIRGAVRARSVDDVRAVMRVAQAQRIPVYPISTGKNWGYGGSVPVRDDCVVLDLGSMDRIVAHDAEMGTLTVEPGVTFERAARFLEEAGGRYLLNVTGAPPVTSVLGNTLERGLGSGPYGDRWQFVCAMEVVLPNGDVVHTGFDRFANAKTASLFRAGVGPMLDGLFTQSNLGIVTRMTLWLSPRQRRFELVQLAVRSREGIAGLADAVRALRFERTLDAAVSIWNDYRAYSMQAQMPWSDLPAGEPLGRARFEERKAALGLASWYGATAIYSPTAALAEARAARVEEVLGDRVDGLAFHRFEDGRHVGTRVARGAAERVGAFGNPEIAAQLWQGTPKWSSARSCYWRKRKPMPARDEDIDVLADECGVLWVAPVVPLEGRAVADAAERMERICLDAGFEPFFSIISQHERTAYFVTMILYDKADAAEDARAVACARALVRDMARAGYYPYRLGIQSMDDLPPARDDYGVVLAAIRRALDPAGVLAPGRYDASESPR